MLNRYAGPGGLYPLEEAVHRMTGLTAGFLGMPRRGYVRDGYWADLVLIDPERIIDRATYVDPFAPAGGIKAVYVNGVKTWTAAGPTGERAGQALRRSSR